MHKRPSLDLIGGFEAAARHLSFTRAAEELSLTQSAVSRQIKALEEQLGVALFQRHTRALSLTAAGETLYRTAADVLRRVDETTQRIRALAAARTFTVTTTPAFASLWLIPRLTSYTRENPKVDVRIAASNEVVDLERSGVELAIRYSGPIESGTQLFGEEVFPVCAPSLLRDPARPLRSPADLTHHVLLHFADTDSGRPMLDWSMWLQAVGVAPLEPAGVLHFSHYDQVVLAAISGQGVALGRTPLIKRLIRDGRLRAPFSTKSVAARAYYVMVSKAGERNADVERFVQWLHAEAKREGLARQQRA